MFEKNGYSLAIENKKIKNKEHIEKIKESFLTNKTIQMLEKNSDAFTYTYGELISKIIFKNDMQTEKSGLFNLVILANKLNSQNYEEFSLRLNALNLRNEIIASILLARFNLAYCYPLDDIYKKDNNYHLDREELLDFSKLDLSEFNPKVLNINKNGLKNAYIQLESNINEIIELKEKISKITNQIQNLEKDEIKKIEKKEILLKLKESLDKMTEKVNEMKEKRVENINYYNEVLKDYEDNYLYFKNLAIIEGIRNSIAHGNVEIINSSLVDNFNNLEIRFYDEYQGKIFFDLTTNLYNFQSLFEEYNISFLRNYQQKILDGNNVKMKVC